MPTILATYYLVLPTEFTLVTVSTVMEGAKGPWALTYLIRTFHQEQPPVRRSKHHCLVPSISNEGLFSKSLFFYPPKIRTL